MTKLALQTLLDTIAIQLDRPVLVEDAELRLVAFSEHQAPVDDVRQESILRRHALPEVAAWVRSFGVAHAQAPVHVSGSTSLGMLPRLCVPLRRRGQLLGFLWFVEGNRPFDAPEVELAARLGAECAGALQRETAGDTTTRQSRTETVIGLVHGTPTARLRCAQSLSNDNLFRHSHHLRAIVVRVASSGVDQAHESELVRIVTAATSVLLSSEREHYVTEEEGVVLVGDGASQQDSVKAVERHVLAGSTPGGERDNGTSEAPGTFRVVAGVGVPVSRIRDVHVSYQQAVQAARVASVFPAAGLIVHWDQAGVYGMLARLLDHPSVRAEDVHPGVVRLQGAEGGRMLRTVEAYLDLAGNASAAAQLLSLHRSSLYYRLRRVEQVTGVDLRDGMDRLALHVAVKLARLEAP